MYFLYGSKLQYTSGHIHGILIDTGLDYNVNLQTLSSNKDSIKSACGKLSTISCDQFRPIHFYFISRSSESSHVC